MNNEPVGKRDVANVLLKNLKSVPNDNVFYACAKQVYIWKSDFIADMTYKTCRVEKKKNSFRIVISGRCIGIKIRA